MINDIKEVLLEAIQYPRPEEVQKVCLPIWNQPFFYKIDKARALTISYNPTDKGARINYPELVSRYKKNEFGNAEEIFDLLYNFKKEVYWRKYYDLFFGILNIPSENIAHMDVSFFPYKKFKDYLDNKDVDDTYIFLQKTIEILSGNLEYILIDGAKNKDIVNFFIKDYSLINSAILPINSGKGHRLYIYKHKKLQTILIYYECFLYGQTCPNKFYVRRLAEYVKKTIKHTAELETNMKRCPKCELNFIADDAELCSYCKDLIVKDKVVKSSNKSKERKFYNETFTFTNEKAKLKGKYGYKAYNSQGKNVGIVYMTDKKGITSYGYCELCIDSNYQYHYGQWHRIFSNGCRIQWETLCAYLKIHSQYVCHID